MSKKLLAIAVLIAIVGISAAYAMPYAIKANSNHSMSGSSMNHMSKGMMNHAGIMGNMSAKDMAEHHKSMINNGKMPAACKEHMQSMAKNQKMGDMEKMMKEHHGNTAVTPN